MMRIYIDESGNSGDLSRVDEGLLFNNQPAFVLTGISLEDEGETFQYVECLKAEYRIRSDQELKFSVLKSKKKYYPLILELVNHITQTQSKYFIELVDKKYQLAVNIVGYFLFPPYLSESRTKIGSMMQILYASWVYRVCKNDMFFDYVQLTKDPCNNKIQKYFERLKEFFNQINVEIKKSIEIKHIKYNIDYSAFSADDKARLQECTLRALEPELLIENKLAEDAITILDETMQLFEQFKKKEGDMAWKRFLPVPDFNKQGLLVWMLPHYSSFTAIYSRLNKAMNGGASNCIMIHDDQKHFDDILLVAKKLMESAEYGNDYEPITSKFTFEEEAKLTFESSSNFGVQIADVISGLTRMVYENSINMKETDPILQEAMNMIIAHSDLQTSIGCNCVVPQSLQMINNVISVCNKLDEQSRYSDRIDIIEGITDDEIQALIQCGFKAELDDLENSASNILYELNMVVSGGHLVDVSRIHQILAKVASQD